MKALVLFGILIVLMLLGLPIVFSIGLSCILYNCIYGAVNLIQLPTRMYASNDSFVYLAIPLFVFAGYLMETGGISQRLVDFVYKICGRIPGALGSVAVISCMIFAALTGSGVATVAAIGGIMYPVMIKNGYDKKFAAGMIAASGALGPIIPPSIPMVVYGATMGVSVSNLFMGGVVPGVLMGVLFIVVNTIYAIKNKLPISEERFTLKEILISFWKSLGLLFLPVMLLGGIYGGILTPTEAATFSVIYTIILTLFYKTFSLENFLKACEKTVITSATMMAIINISGLFGFIMSMEGIPQIITNAVLPHMTSKYLYLAILLIFLIIVGAIMDTAPAIMILAPILVPIGESLGLDPMFIGIIFCVILIAGMMTPPFGLTLFAMSSTGKIKFEEVVKGVVPFLVVAFIVLALITFFPGLTMLLIK